uniref:Calponin-homology (CH) domain-containing protein n=1 Tax=Ditylenchus dipsaci TaxID=166011 RepID=A0A915CNU5_9BILA
MTTFLNYLNYEHLGRQEWIKSVEKDLSDGIKLIRIVESAQKRVFSTGCLEQDGVRLVNIGSRDIVSGNLKLILSLIWRFIEHYHIPASGCKSTPQKKLLMAWLQSVLPEFRLTNFRTNWNDGVALSALVDYCKPGLLDWKLLNLNNRHTNCKTALELAEQHLAVPMIISPHHLCSAHLDEPSCVTYLAYFVRRNGPGYKATLRNSQKLLSDVRLLDLERSWNDGFLLCKLTEAIGGHIPGFKDMIFDDPCQWAWNITQALECISTEFGIVSLVGAESIAGYQNAYMGILALCAALSCPPSKSPKSPSSQQLELAIARSQQKSYIIQQPVHIHLVMHQPNPISFTFNAEDLQLVVIGPNGSKLSPKTIKTTQDMQTNQVILSFTPQDIGKHTAHIICEGKELSTSPISFQVVLPFVLGKASYSSMAKYSEPLPVGIEHVSFSGLQQPCALGSLVEIVVNAQVSVKTVKGEVTVLAFSPTGACKPCDVVYENNSYVTTFTPTEIGEWQIHILYNGRHIKGSPFQCHVYDSSLIDVYGLDVGSVGQELKFTVDASKAGKGDIEISIIRQGRQVPCHISEKGGPSTGVYSVHFTPDGAGQYKIHIIFNDQEVKGSPFLLDIADASAVSVHGDHLRNTAVGKIATFFIHAVGVENKDISVTVAGPSNRKKHARVVPLDESTYKVEWKPIEAGEHIIDVDLFGLPVPESPFHCNVGDPEQVTVMKMPKYIDATHLNTPHSFEIDATAAGSGNLEIFINGGLVVCRVRELAPRHFEAEFTPVQLVKHVIEMKFNGQNVLNSPWILPIRDADDPGQEQKISITSNPITHSTHQERELIGVGLAKAAVGQVSSFDIKSDTLKPENLSVRLTDSNGKEMNVVVIQRNGRLRCEYQLPKVGEYQLEIFINGQLVDCGPLFISSYEVQKVFIRPVGDTELGKPVHFIVDAVEAGKGQLEISVNQGQVPNNVQMQDAGRCLVTFIPQKTGTYMIDVTFNGNQVQGCPIKVDVQAKQEVQVLAARRPLLDLLRPLIEDHHLLISQVAPPH